MGELSTTRIDKLRWLTLILIIFVGTTSAFLNALSVYIGPLAERGWDPSIVIVAYSIMMFMALPGSILGGKLKEKFGNRLVLKVGGIGFAASVVAASFSPNPWMYVVCMGGLAPFFVYCIYVAQIANVGELFPDKRGFAIGLTMAGIALGSSLIVPLAEWVTRIMELMHGIALFGIIFGGLTFLAGFIIVEAPEGYRPEGWSPKEYEVLDPNNADGSEGVKDVNWRKLLLLGSFWLIFLATVAVGIFTSGMMSNFVMISTKVLNVSDASGAWLFTVFSIAMGGSGFIAGWISDRILGPVKVIAIGAMVAVVMSGIFILTGGNSFVLFVILIVILGFSSGCTQTLTPNILMTAWGSKYFGINYGICLMALTASAFIGPQFTVRDPIINFFIIGAAGMLVGTIMFFIAGKVLNKELGKKIF